MQKHQTASIMKKAICLLLTLGFILACNKVPMTGRRQLSLIPASQINEMSFTTYRETIANSRLSTNQEQIVMIQRVGNRMKTAVETYMEEAGLSSRLQGYEWEFNLIDDPAANAWAMPGGKIAFYTGILPICHDEDGVAVVMGHEIAHAVARHGNERMSQGLATQLGGVGLSVAMRDKPEETRNLFFGAYGVGAQLGVMLPFSRLHESEADKMGLIFMAIAGYDPNHAVAFWERMQQYTGGAEPPEFLSTHPSHTTRIRDLQAAMPEAMRYYNK